MRQELKAEDFGQVESLKIAGILYVFPNFQTARIGQKIRFSAVAELFRGSLNVSAFFMLLRFLHFLQKLLWGVTYKNRDNLVWIVPV